MNDSAIAFFEGLLFERCLPAAVVQRSLLFLFRRLRNSPLESTCFPYRMLSVNALEGLPSDGCVSLGSEE
jgi:hypothetical protein